MESAEEKSKMDRVLPSGVKLLTGEQQVTFCPQGNIIVGEIPAKTRIVGQSSNKTILTLDYKSKESQSEPFGIGMKDLSLFIKPSLMSIRSGGNDGRQTESQFLRFLDAEDASTVCFTAVSQLHLTAVAMGESFLGLIDSTALDQTSTSSVTCQDKNGDDLFEIMVNGNPLAPPKAAHTIEICAHKTTIGCMKIDASDKENKYNFIVSFPRDLSAESKCVLLTASFLVYSSRFLPKFGAKVDGSCCHIL